LLKSLHRGKGAEKSKIFTFPGGRGEQQRTERQSDRVKMAE